MASFKESFASARKAGKKTFSWNGKSYTTELAKGATGPKTRPSGMDMKGPKARPNASSAGPKARPMTPEAAKKIFGAPEAKPDNLGNLSQRTKNAEARAAKSTSDKAAKKAKVQSDAANLRKKLGFDK